MLALFYYTLKDLTQSHEATKYHKEEKIFSAKLNKHTANI